MSEEIKIESVRLPELTASSDSKENLVSLDALKLLKNVKVSLEVLVGSTEIDIQELFDLKANSTLRLNESLSQPIKLNLDGKTVAEGELVAVGDNFGIKILNVNGWK